MTTSENTPPKVKHPYTGIRIWQLTKTIARRLAFDNDETLVAFLHRIVLAEQARRKANAIQFEAWAGLQDEQRAQAGR